MTGNAEVYVCLDEHLLRQIDGKFGSQSSVIIKSLGGYLEALSPGLLLEVACLNLEYFWHPKGLSIKFRKSLEVKISLESLMLIGSYLWLKACYSINLSENQIWVLISTEAYHKTKGPPQNCLRLGDRAKCCQKLIPSLLEYQKWQSPLKNQISNQKGLTKIKS